MQNADFNLHCAFGIVHFRVYGIRAVREASGAERGFDHDRHAESGPCWRIRMDARADADARRARPRGRGVRPRVRRRTDHVAVARVDPDRPVSARPRLARQRHPRLGHRAHARHRASCARLQHGRLRRRVPSRSSVRSGSRLRRLRRSPGPRARRPPGQRAARIAGDR